MTTSRRVLSLLDVVRPVLRSIDRLPPKSRPGLIGVILYMVLSMVVLEVVDGQRASEAIGFLGIAGAMVVIATAGRYAPLFVVILLAFCISIIYLNQQPSSAFAATVVNAREPGPDEVKSAASIGKESVDDSVLVSGNIRLAGSNAAVQGALVTVDGFGGSGADTTNSRGYFEIRVPLRIIKMRGDSVKLAIETSGTEMVTMAFSGRPLDITLRPQAAPTAGAAWRAGEYASFTAFRDGPPDAWAPPPAPVRAQERFRARVVLDSVRTLHDGSSGDTYWRFDVNVNNVHAITIPVRAYDDRAGRNLLFLAGEVTMDAPRAAHLLIQIRGLRDAFIGVHQINGYEFVDPDSLPPEQPVHRELRLVHESDPRGKGEFIFYYTVIRRGTPNIRVNPAGGAAGSSLWRA